ncbi:hypothetical protein, partial [Polynucleobacter alcilacus]|uniref:hypothetical protein n=1 Tax=Polynucleobacter alcilacus TaxID=1819739 RepID=UPI001C0BD1B0
MANLKDFGPTLDLSNSEVHSLLVEGTSPVGPGAHGTHLTTSLNDLQKLGIEAVSLAGGVESEASGEDLFTIDLGSNGPTALHETVEAGLPKFSNGELGLVTDIQTLLGNNPETFLGDVQALSAAGVEEIELNDLASAHHTSLDSLFNGTDFNGASLASLGAATSTLRDNGIDEV